MPVVVGIVLPLIAVAVGMFLTGGGNDGALCHLIFTDLADGVAGVAVLGGSGGLGVAQHTRMGGLGLRVDRAAGAFMPVVICIVFPLIAVAVGMCGCLIISAGVTDIVITEVMCRLGLGVDLVAARAHMPVVVGVIAPVLRPVVAQSRILTFKGPGGLSGTDLSALAAVIIEGVIGAVRLTGKCFRIGHLLIKLMHVVCRHGLGEGVFNGHLIRASVTNSCGVAIDISLERVPNGGEPVAVIGFQRNSDRILRVRLEYNRRTADPYGTDDRVLLRFGGHCLCGRFTHDGALDRCADTRNQFIRNAQPGNVLDLRFAAGEAGQKPFAALRLCGLLGHGAGVPVVAPRRRGFAPLHGLTADLADLIAGIAAGGAGRRQEVYGFRFTVSSREILAVRN